jgi:ribosomal protein L11 methyltransferase
MSWLQLRLDCDQASADALEAAAPRGRRPVVTLEDRGDEPLLEPGVGETPLWQAIRLTGLFPADADMDAVMDARLRDACPRRGARVEILEDKDWSREWMQHYRPMRFGERLWICPSWLEPPEPDAVNLLLDPGLAFGTGTHPTTAMCLSRCRRRVRDGQRVVDYGCGSGMLGIAALRLGAARLLAVDNDPQALTATRDNAERNGIALASAAHRPARRSRHRRLGGARRPRAGQYPRRPPGGPARGRSATSSRPGASCSGRAARARRLPG